MSILESSWSAIQHYCAYQDRCHSEVRSKLIALQCYGDDLEEAISMLIEQNFLNEERFARSYVRGKFNSLKWGKNKIIQSLKFKQVSTYCINKGISEIDTSDYFNVILKLITSKWENLEKEPNDWHRSQKVTRYMLQKGFEQSLIQEAILIVKEENN